MLRQLFFLISSVLFSLAVFGADASTGSGRFDFRKKATSKEGSRWTLQEWMAQKERNQIMDLWLAMYAPTPYEFFLGGSYLSYETSVDNPQTKNSFTSTSGRLGAYATVVGVEVEYENNTKENYSDLLGSLQLRVLGNAVQGTHLILGYGMKTRTMEGATQTTLRPQFASADLNIYLNRFFGIQGAYRYELPLKDETYGEVKSSRGEAGIFIDFNAVRIFGAWFNEREERTLNSSTTITSRTGGKSGLIFFF